MRRILPASAALLLALAAAPLAAQPVIKGFDDLHWGATRDSFAEMVWRDPAGGPTAWLRVGPSTGVISVATAAPEFHRWFDTSAPGRERWDRVRRAAGGR